MHETLDLGVQIKSRAVRVGDESGTQSPWGCKSLEHGAGKAEVILWGSELLGRSPPDPKTGHLVQKQSR